MPRKIVKQGKGTARECWGRGGESHGAVNSGSIRGKGASPAAVRQVLHVGSTTVLSLTAQCAWDFLGTKRMPVFKRTVRFKRHHLFKNNFENKDLKGKEEKFCCIQSTCIF